MTDTPKAGGGAEWWRRGDPDRDHAWQLWRAFYPKGTTYEAFCAAWNTRASTPAPMATGGEVERVARAICEARGMSWVRLTPFGLKNIRKEAEAAIAAIAALATSPTRAGDGELRAAVEAAAREFWLADWSDNLRDYALSDWMEDNGELMEKAVRAAFAALRASDAGGGD